MPLTLTVLFFFIEFRMQGICRLRLQRQLKTEVGGEGGGMIRPEFCSLKIGLGPTMNLLIA